MDLTDIQNGGIIGFKYFGFGGLAQASKGINAFDGTKSGDGTKLCVNLTPKGKGAFSIRVMLDGPYANATWNGKEIGKIEIPENAVKEARNYEVDVPAVEGLSGKHAIYLVVEGKGNEGLLDLHGIGFTKSGQTCERPVVPEITITVDGKKIALPSKPVFSTNGNGLMDLTHYQAYAPLRSNSTIKATAKGGKVDIQIGKIVDGRATVKCEFNGKEKIYLIN